MERNFDATVFIKNRPRLMGHDVGRPLFDEVVWTADEESEYFSVDGTLIEAAASLKSFRPKEGAPPPTDDGPDNPSMDFRGERRSNETHANTTDPEAHLLRKGGGKKARLAFMGHVLIENPHGLLRDFTVRQATGTAEREAVPKLLDGMRERGYHPRTLGADRGCDTKNNVKDMRSRWVTPHVARKQHSAIDGRTTRPTSHVVSLRIRKRVEEIFSWMKTVGGLRRTRYRGVARTGFAGYLVTTAYNLVRMAKLVHRARSRTRAAQVDPQKALRALQGFAVAGPARPVNPAHDRSCRCHQNPILPQPARPAPPSTVISHQLTQPHASGVRSVVQGNKMVRLRRKPDE